MPPASAAGSQPARPHWGSRVGFVLSAIGSAVGFGSIARFPMNAANNGGALFVLLYAGIMLLVGIPMMIAEFSIGRAAARNPVGAFERLAGPRSPWKAAGFLYVLIPAFFLSWYAVVSGWTLRYVFGSLTGSYFSDPDAAIGAALDGPDAIAWTAAVLGLVLLAVLGGVAKGIERVNLIMMPALFLIIIGLAVYATTLDGVVDGYRFYLRPEASALSMAVVTAAVGQAFFSLSLGQGAMMTYASYLPERSSLPANALIIAASTLTFAVTCGFMIFPLLSAFGMLGTQEAGLGLIFGPLSRVFAAMGPVAGPVVATAFFVATFFAAFTSAVSLVEPAIAYFVEQHAITRRKAAVLALLLIYTAGILPAISTEVLDLEGGALTDALVILGGLLIALYVGWRTPLDVAAARIDSGSTWRVARWVLPVVRYPIPAVLAALLFFAVMGTPCGLTGGDPGLGVLEQMTSAQVLGCE